MRGATSCHAVLLPPGSPRRPSNPFLGQGLGVKARLLSRPSSQHDPASPASLCSLQSSQWGCYCPAVPTLSQTRPLFLTEELPDLPFSREPSLPATGWLGWSPSCPWFHHHCDRVCLPLGLHTQKGRALVLLVLAHGLAPRRRHAVSGMKGLRR